MRFVTINRDPFSRADLVRRLVHKSGCWWCGRVGRFQYGWWDDSRPAPEWARGTFCGVSCYRDYHDERAP